MPTDDTTTQNPTPGTVTPLGDAGTGQTSDQTGTSVPGGTNVPPVLTPTEIPGTPAPTAEVPTEQPGTQEPTAEVPEAPKMPETPGMPGTGSSTGTV